MSDKKIMIVYNDNPVLHRDSNGFDKVNILKSLSKWYNSAFEFFFKLFRDQLSVKFIWNSKYLKNCNIIIYETYLIRV